MSKIAAHSLEMCFEKSTCFKYIIAHVSVRIFANKCVSVYVEPPPPKLTAANILLTEPPEQRGISAVNANTHIRWKSSHSRAWRHSHDLERRTLFLTPKRQAVCSNPAGITRRKSL